MSEETIDWMLRANAKAKGKRPSYFEDPATDRILSMLMALVGEVAVLRERLDALDLDQPYPGKDAEGQRGRAGSPKTPHMPHGWLDSRELSDEFRRRLAEAELSVSGG